MRICDVLAVPRGITAVVGGGGKTSLIWRLATELCQMERVLLTAPINTEYDISYSLTPALMRVIHKLRKLRFF